VSRWRTVRRVAATVFVGLVVPGAAAAAPVHDPRKPTAVVVLGLEGANAADMLAPYEVLGGTGAFNGALRDIARTSDVATARWVAKTLQYPATGPQLSGPAWPWALTLRPILFGAAAALGIQFLRGNRSSS
jgi:hypothetical protein